MTSPISSWFSHLFRANTLTPPPSTKSSERQSQEREDTTEVAKSFFSLKIPLSPAKRDSPKVTPLSSQETSTKERIQQVSVEISKLSRSWFSFLYKGRIQTLQATQKELQDVSNQEQLHAAKIVFSENFQSTGSVSTKDCAEALYALHQIDSREAAELFLSEAQSNPERAAEILLAAKDQKKSISNLINPLLTTPLSQQQIQSLIKIFKLILPHEISSEQRESLFRTNDTATIPLFRLIASQVLRDVLPRIRHHATSTDATQQYWKDLSSSLSRNPILPEYRAFFRTFRDAIQNKLDSDDKTANQRMLSILTNRLLVPSIMPNKKASATIMKTASQATQIVEPLTQK